MTERTTGWGPRARQALWLFSVVVIGAMTLGANCNPGTNPAPGCADCPAGQVRGCLDKCVTPVSQGGVCSVDSCAPDGRCEGNLSCVQINGSAPKCVDVGLSLGSYCAGSFFANDPCPTAMFCKSAYCTKDAGLGNICALPADTIGSACDGDLGRPALTTACSPCAASMTCLKGHCQPKCTVDADCPCGRGLSCSTGRKLDPSTPDGACVTCKQIHGTGCGDTSPCCDGTICVASKCCRATNDGCAAKADCCGTDICLAGKCRECGQRDAGVCRTSDDCCSGLECVAGTCRKLCVAPNGVCDVPGQTGECKNGAMACLDTFGDPVCKQIHTATAEVCDGKDNDCNGVIDDIKEEGCSSTPSITAGADVNCPSWFISPGKWKCGAAPDFTRYCNTGGNFCYACNVTLPSGGFCGRCPGDTCTGFIAGNECAPRYSCVEGTTCGRRADCGATTILPRCWSPEWRGECVKD